MSWKIDFWAGVSEYYCRRLEKAVYQMKLACGVKYFDKEALANVVAGTALGYLCGYHKLHHRGNIIICINERASMSITPALRESVTEILKMMLDEFEKNPDAHPGSANLAPKAAR